jgi:hypothetical protein
VSSPVASIMAAVEDQEVFGPWFKKPATWAAWFAFLRVLFGLPMDEVGWALFRQCTGRDDRPADGFREAWLVCGRRGGKSIVLALIAVYLATFYDWSAYLSPGERATVMIIAVDRRQSRTIFRYLRALITRVPMLAALIERETADTLDLSNGVTLEIQTASYRSTRGYTLIACLLDELAFFRSDEGAANPDQEIIAAIRPAMASVPGSMLLCASSPYARRGALWTAYRKHFGKPSSVLVWRADTRTMNPTIDQGVIDDAMEADPASAAAEYGAQFRVDVETFVSREVVESCVETGCFERPYLSRYRYFGFVDPSGGSADSMTACVAHMEGGRVLIDAVREAKPPFSPELIVADFAKTLRNDYRISTVRGDRYGGEWPREQFRKHGIQYEPAEKTCSDLYAELLPLLNSRKISLLDDARMVAQLVNLERKTSKFGKDAISHPPGQHDDRVNAIAGAAHTASTAAQVMMISDAVLEYARRMPRRASAYY